MHGQQNIKIWIPFLTFIQNSHLKRVERPDSILIEFDLPRISIIVLETCRGM